MKQTDDSSFAKWRSQLDRYMIKKYALSIELSGSDNERLRRHFDDGDIPLETVEFYAEKYDFVYREDFLAYR
jgi:hypothetical protein